MQFSRGIRKTIRFRGSSTTPFPFTLRTYAFTDVFRHELLVAFEAFTDRSPQGRPWLKTRADDETMKSTSIKVGDKFIKPEVPNTVWVVTQLVDLPRLPPHAELKVQGHFSRMMLMSQEALADHRLYHRIEDS